MKRSECIAKLERFVLDNYCNVNLECEVDELVTDILEFLEKEIGMKPPMIIVQNENGTGGIHSHVFYNWELES